jgi:ABC-type lipoprotein export system ATPase subunit
MLVTHDPHIAAMAERKVELYDGLIVEPKANAA